MNQSTNYTNYYLLLLSSLILHLIALIAQPISSFSLQSFNLDQNPNFESSFALLGDAHITHEGNLVNLTSSGSNSSSGQIVYKKPLKFLDPKTSKPLSFSSEFSFSITHGVGDGIAFVIFPSNWGFSKVFDDQGYFGLFSGKLNQGYFGKFIVVEINTRKDDQLGVGVGNFVSNVSSIGLVLNDGVLLTTWINYDANSMRLEIRLAKYGTNRPTNPLISYPIDLSRIWDVKEDVLIGISSSRSGSNQISSLSSWSFEIETNPEIEFDEEHEHVVDMQKSSCVLSVLGGVIFATGCGTLVAFLGLFVWVIFFGRHSHSNNVVPDLSLNPVNFKYEKVDVIVDDNPNSKRSSIVNLVH